MADYTSIHTGTDIDSGITKTETLSGVNTGDNSVNTNYINDYRSGNFVSGTDYEPAKSADDNYVTDAEKTVIGNTSGTNTGDNSANTTYADRVDSDTAGVTGADQVTNMMSLTQAEYDVITPNASTFYIIVE